MAAYPLLVCTVYAAPLRATATHRAEQVSQLLFGETAQLLEEDANGWCRVQCTWDGYEGWCRRSMLLDVSGRNARMGGNKMVMSSRSFLQTAEGGEIPLPLGAMLWGLRHNLVDLGFTKGCFKGRRERLSHLSVAKNDPVAAAMQYRETPYGWGGRTQAGIDCSGLIQMAFKLCGQAVPRDAWQQALIGETVDFLQHSQSGDVAFFDNEDGRIIHVGLLVDPSHILHATETSGRTVIDRIDGEGIISVQLRKRTHRLRVIKRFFGTANQPADAAVQAELF
ncbi:MAG: hydrolase [Sphingobacteriales bacterium]|nr:MAG: hydrolase [Sphingobacteriales bacterium]